MPKQELMTYTAYIPAMTNFPGKEAAVCFIFLPSVKENTDLREGVGIKFARKSANISALVVGKAFIQPKTGCPVNNITVNFTGRKQSRPGSYVTEMVFCVGAQGCNEPSVLCRSTFL